MKGYWGKGSCWAKHYVLLPNLPKIMFSRCVAMKIAVYLERIVQSTIRELAVEVEVDEVGVYKFLPLR